MNTFARSLAILLAALTLTLSAQAAIIPFDLQGTDGPGLLPGNENPDPGGAGTEGTGGEIGAGITFDDVSLTLSINIGWGSGNGFTDLTGNATVGHVHGPTTNGPPIGFTENASPLGGGVGDLHTKPVWDPSASSGSFQGVVVLSSTQAAELLAGRYYINIHTTSNPGGEIRGHLVAVPEPGAVFLLSLGAAGLVAALRRRK